MRIRPRTWSLTELECVSRMQTAAPVASSQLQVLAGVAWRKLTIRAAAPSKDRITSSSLNGCYDR